jgi:hypothetical protein
MKTMSLLVPTRKRPSFLKEYLDSLAQTTCNPDRIEVLVGYDNNDELTDELFNSGIVNNYKFKVIPHKRERSLFLNRDYYNWLAEKSNSDYLFVNADDVRFVIPEWDRKVEAKVEMFCNDKPDRIVGVGVKDNTPKPKRDLPDFPCFPLVTKESFAYFKFVLHGFVPTWGADYLFYLLYEGAGRYLAINDLVYMHHIGVHTHTAPKDETAAQIERTFNQLKMNPEHNVDVHKLTTIPKQSQELRTYLSSLGAK